jgi:hypothetical protein
MPTTNCDAIIKNFHSSRKKGYGNNLPGALDKDFINLARFYLGTNDTNRDEIRSKIPDDTLLLIIGFSDRMATLADRNKDEKYLLFALAAHSIEDFRFDYRENIIRLSLVNHITEKLGVDAVHLFKNISNISSKRTAEYLTDFLNRPPELKQIGTMNIVEIETPEGVDYKYE